MGRWIPEGRCYRESHGSRKLEKNSVGACGEGGVTIGSGGGGGKDGKVAPAQELRLFSLQSLTAAAAQEEGGNRVTVQLTNRHRSCDVREW